jgi:hypothetical protein
MFLLAICVLFTGFLCAGWHWFSQRRVRRKALRVKGWIEAALGGQGRAMAIEWLCSSRFQVPLRLAGSMFHRAWLTVDLIPSEIPIQWMWNKLTHRQELITFQADLDWAPSFSLEVHSFRWFARSSQRSSVASDEWAMQQTSPFIMATRIDWQKEVTSAMTALAASGQRDFLAISFSRHSPHFSVTMPLEAISPACPTRACIFDAVREVAASSLPSLF